MRLPIFPCLVATLIAGALVAAPARAFADTYTVVNLGSDQGYFFYGMNDLGSVVLDNPGCGVSGCYFSFLNGVSAGTTFSAPVITTDDGVACIPSVPAGGSVQHGVCNNGRDAFTGFLSGGQARPGVYTDPTFQSLLGNGGSGFLYMNSLGDIVFDDEFSENWFEAVDQTTAVTPEPASFLLLATAGLGLFAMVALRRRTA